MGKKLTIFLIVFFVCISSVFALNLKDPQPYEKIEFPKWTLDLRRAETIFFGSLPITVPVTFLLFNTFKSDWEFWPKLGVALGASAVLSITDYVLGIISSDS